jgi:hypothetical protein
MMRKTPAWIAAGELVGALGQDDDVDGPACAVAISFSICRSCGSRDPFLGTRIDVHGVLRQRRDRLIDDGGGRCRRRADEGGDGQEHQGSPQSRLDFGRRVTPW